MTKQGLQDYRIEELERNYKSLNDKVDLLLTNHLPHVNEALVSLKTRVTLATTFNIGAIILGLLAAKFIQ